MTHKAQIQEDMKTAMRAKDSRRLAVIRLLMAAIKQREVDERIALDDLQTLSVVEKMIKQRRESIKQYESGNRADLAEQEKFEIDLLQAYLPPQLDDAEIDKLVKEALESTGANDMKDMGKVMGVLKPKLQGQADMSVVSKKIKDSLS